MGLFDNYLDDLKRELSRANESVDKMKAGAQKVVKAIDAAENKISEATDEKTVKKLGDKIDQAKKIVKD